MRNLMERLWKDESGLTILEYGIAAAVIAALVVAVMGVFKGKVEGWFNQVPDNPNAPATSGKK